MAAGHNSSLKCDPGQDSTLKFDPGQDSTLKFDPASWFHVELLPGVLIPHWIMIPGLNKMLNFDIESLFNVLSEQDKSSDIEQQQTFGDQK